MSAYRFFLSRTKCGVIPSSNGELACGNLKRREEILGLMMALPEVRLAEHHEVLHLIKSHRLYGRDLGWVDSHLLASTFLMHCTR